METVIDWSKAPEWATHAIRKIVGPEKGKLEFSVVVDGEHRISPDGLWFHPDAYEVAGLRPRPPKINTTWTGEGLPPVGTVCRLSFNGSDQGVVTVNYITTEFCVCKNHDFGHEQGSPTENYNFTPIRTPEQITAEEREKAIDGMLEIIDAGFFDNARAIYAAIYDAGYRKQVAT